MNKKYYGQPLCKIGDRKGDLEIIDIKSHYNSILKSSKRFIIKCHNCGKYFREGKHFFNSGNCGCLQNNNIQLLQYYCSMKQRCGKIKTYKNIKVCDEWVKDKNKYFNFVKDILSGLLGINKEYSPKTLIAVSPRLNLIHGLIKKKGYNINMEEYNILLLKYLNRHINILGDKLDIETINTIKNKTKDILYLMKKDCKLI